MHSNNINTLRFFGAFLVLFGHTFALCYGPGGGEDPISELIKSFTGYRAKLPGIGVAIFFVLSGYLVTKSYLRSDNLMTYLEARILRIYPALWMALLLTVLVMGPLVTSLELTEYFSHQGTWKYLFHNAKLYPNISHRLPGVFLDNPRAGGVNGSLWTLPVEVRMYLIVAVLGLLGLLTRRWIFNLVACAIVAFYLIAPDKFFFLHSLRHERLGVYFLFGALAFVNRDILTLHWLGVLFLGAIAAINFKGAFYDVTFAVCLGYVTLYIAFHEHIKFPDFAAHGDFSYGLYLYAFPITQLWILFIGPGKPWLVFCATFATTMLLAVSSWHLVEKPTLRLKGNLSSWIETLVGGRKRRSI